MDPITAANLWIAANGLGRALWFARQNNPPDTNLDRFVADQPNTDPVTLTAVFGTALAAIAAGATIRSIGQTGAEPSAVPPVDPNVPHGAWRYRFTIRFDPLASQITLRTNWRSHVEDYPSELSAEQLTGIADELMRYWQSRYAFDAARYDAQFIVESITRGQGALLWQDDI